ncbi:hypothetical protein SELMODRAFT_111826 [Selaginella moellendorffii]|uniref:Uncharacterized protein n=2 Tax=Selaginella moellendorffii TaxID=88036 RepID=D8S9C4_SELML|nr:hypothetical protein SELMODRAFT_111826 [Selaginella moellendorffii]
MLGKRWVMLVAGLWIQFTAGSPYVFGLYSESLKRALGYTQTQLDTIAFFKGIGANVGIHAGLLYLLVPPWAILAIGSLLNLAGYLSIWLAAAGRLERVDFWQVCVFMLLAANAQTFLNTAVVVTSVANFPSSRGTVVGLMKGGLGLSGAVLTLMFRTLRTRDQVSYTLFAALVPSLASLLLMFLIRPLPVAIDRFETTNLHKISGIIVAIAFLLVPISIASPNQALAMDFSALLILLLLASPLLVALRAELTAEEDQSTQEQARLLEPEDPPRSSRKPGLQLGQEFTLAQALSSLEFWLLFVSAFCGMGTGLTTIDNVNQLGLSLGHSKRDISIVVSLMSVWNFLGRFLAGVISDKFLHSQGFPRPAFIAIALGAQSLGHLVVAMALPGALYVGTLAILLGYGAHWSLMPATVSEIFGLGRFGALFNTLTVASPLGSYVFSVQVAGSFYDKEAREQGSSSCYGSHCFMATFLILAGVCVFGCLTTLVMVATTREFYKTRGFENSRERI